MNDLLHFAIRIALHLLFLSPSILLAWLVLTMVTGFLAHRSSQPAYKLAWEPVWGAILLELGLSTILRVGSDERTSGRILFAFLTALVYLFCVLVYSSRVYQAARSPFRGCVALVAGLVVPFSVGLAQNFVVNAFFR